MGKIKRLIEKYKVTIVSIVVFIFLIPGSCVGVGALAFNLLGPWGLFVVLAMIAAALVLPSTIEIDKNIDSHWDDLGTQIIWPDTKEDDDSE